MSGHYPLSNRRDVIEADPPPQARVAVYKRAMEDAVVLHAMREPVATPEPNGAFEVTPAQSHSPRADVDDDPYLSTLLSYVEEFGGHLELNAVFPDQTITLVATPEPTARDSSAADEHAEALATSG